MHLIEKLERESMSRGAMPVRVGDTVEVHYLIREGEKERVQLFIGTVIACKGRGIRRNLTVRRIVQGEGVERIFPVHSPRVATIEVKKQGKVRRAKLHYLRERIGRSTKVEERTGSAEAVAAAAKEAKAEAAKAEAAKAEAAKAEAKPEAKTETPAKK